MTDAQNSGHAAPGRPFPPGVSGNPGGRPKGFAAYIRDQTADGQELVDFALMVVRGKRRATMRQRLEALAWLADRGWGKAVQTHQVGDGQGNALDLVSLLLLARGQHAD